MEGFMKKIKNFFEKVKGAFAKIGKRNLIVICSVLLIGTAICLNLVLFSDKSDNKSDGVEIGTGAPSGGASYAGGETKEDDDAYFAASVVSRQRARDEAMEVLRSVVDNSDTVESVKTQALGDISRIALDMEREANIETLIKSKGFEECVAVVSGTTANIIVKSDGLMPNEIAKITEIVYEQAGIDPSNLRIVEKK